MDSCGSLALAKDDYVPVNGRGSLAMAKDDLLSKR